ncbi:MAG: tol-pal system protein YbgF [Gammaproteobacteria bacterium]
MKTAKRFKTTAALLLAGAFAAGCALPPEEDPVLLKLDELDQRVGTIERVVRNESLLQIATELEELRNEVRELRGHTEALQYEAEGAATRQRDQYLDLDQRLQSLERRTRGGDAPTGTAPSAASPLGVGGGPSAPAGATGAGESERYQAALELLRQGRYPQAEAGFKQFLADFPQSTLADNAQYWLGETHYVNRDFETALAVFQQMLEDYPNSRKAPDALLKAGFCQYELQRWADARASLEAVVEQYPDSTAARLANQRLERMRSERR